MIIKVGALYQFVSWMSLIDPNKSLLRKQLKIIEVRRENGCMWILDLDKNKQQFDKKNQTMKANVFTTNTNIKLNKTPKYIVYTLHYLCHITKQCTIHQMLIFNQNRNECKLCLHKKKEKILHKAYFPIHLHTNNCK